MGSGRSRQFWKSSHTPASRAVSIGKYSVCIIQMFCKSRSPKNAVVKAAVAQTFSRNFHIPRPDGWLGYSRNFLVSSCVSPIVHGKRRNCQIISSSNTNHRRALKKKCERGWTTGIHLGKGKPKVVAWLEEDRIEQKGAESYSSRLCLWSWAWLSSAPSGLFPWGR